MNSAAERIIDALAARQLAVKANGPDSWQAQCPAHDDRKPSLSITRVDGKLLLCCQAGCKTEDIMGGIELPMAALFDDWSPNGKPLAPDGARVRSDAGGDTWTPHGDAVDIYPYHGAGGELLYEVCRTADKQFPVRRPDPSSRSGWRWNLKGVDRVPYRLPEVIGTAKAGETIYIVEGEKDVHAIEKAGGVSTCNPGGAGKWRKEYAEHLEGASVVVVADRDGPGRKHAQEVATSLGKSVVVVEAAEGNDAADHLAAGRGLDGFVKLDLPAPPENDRTDRTVSANRHGKRDSAFGRGPNTHRTPTEHSPPDLARDPELLGRHDALVGSMGLVGERSISRLTFLTHISRLLNSPARLVIKGDSSTGKSEAVRCALVAAAPEELWVRSQTSALALFYTEDDLRHRTLVFYEATKLGEDDDPLAQVLRTLISEGELRYEVTVPEKRSTQLLEREGPVAFISTTTKASLDREIETRILSAHSDNSDEQTTAVVKAILMAEGAGLDFDVDLAPWHQLDRWLRDDPRDVVAPWAKALGSFDLAGPPRLRRDVTNLLSLGKANALLHRGMREEDERGRVISTTADYEVVCELLSSVLAIATDKAVREGTRKIVEAVRALRLEEPDKTISLRAAASSAGRAYSTTSTDVHDALDRGYLVDRSTRENAYNLDLGDPLPESSELLPTPEQLEERFHDPDRSVGVRSVFGRGPNAETQSQSQKAGGVRSVRSNPAGAASDGSRDRQITEAEYAERFRQKSEERAA